MLNGARFESTERFRCERVQEPSAREMLPLLSAIHTRVAYGARILYCRAVGRVCSLPAYSLVSARVQVCLCMAVPFS